MDADSNKSASNPAKLLWLDSGVTFANVTNYDPGALDEPLYPAISGNSSRIPYLTPSIPGHTYIALLYQSPPNFAFPPNFPYSNTFRSGFNVSKIAVDFKTSVLEANYFTIKSNATATASASASGTGGYGTGPTAYAATSSIAPFKGSANTLKEPWISWTICSSVVAMILVI